MATLTPSQIKKIHLPRVVSELQKESVSPETTFGSLRILKITVTTKRAYPIKELRENHPCLKSSPSVEVAAGGESDRLTMDAPSDMTVKNFLDLLDDPGVIAATFNPPKQKNEGRINSAQTKTERG